jgi:hypothetical protein
MLIYSMSVSVDGFLADRGARSGGRPGWMAGRRSRDEPQKRAFSWMLA